MRQGPDQLEFLKISLRVREGNIQQSDWKVINSRFEGHLTSEEKKGFESETCLTVMETWNEVNLENHNKIRNLNECACCCYTKQR